MTEPPKVEEFGWVYWTDQEWIKLDFAVMRECGPAAQTFGGLLRVTQKETFASVKAIAAKARLPIKTVRRHLTALHKAGFIRNLGRQKTRAGAPRRTCTIQVTGKHLKAEKKRSHLMEYGFLPWWACCRIRNFQSVYKHCPASRELPWSVRALLSLVLARYVALTKLSREETHDDFGELDNSARWMMSLDRICETTGLSRPSVVAAKRMLHRCTIIENCGGSDREHGGSVVDELWPNVGFRVVVTEAPKGGSWIDFSPDKRKHRGGVKKWAIGGKELGNTRSKKVGTMGV